jgi:hypothetical protein
MNNSALPKTYGSRPAGHGNYSLGLEAFPLRFLINLYRLRPHKGAAAFIHRRIHMKKLTFTMHVFAACLLVVAAAATSNAQATRTWVSGTGMDSNPCSRTAPCQTFAGAIAKTAACGEISVLDPHGFGAVTITKSITINGEGSLASVLSTLGSTAIIVNAAATDNVYLKNLDINGACSGLNGITWLAGNTLILDKVRIYNFTNLGVNVSKTATGYLSVSNSHVSNCVAGGIVSTTSGGTVRADINDTKVFGCTNGYKAGTNSQFTIKSSTASGCGTAGFLASGSTAVINMESCVATHNGNGVKSDSSAVVRVGQSTVANNITKGLDITGGGSIESYQDNYIGGNPGSDAPIPVGKS